MYKKLLKDTSLYSLSNVVARGFSLLTFPIYTRFLSPADYGALDLLGYFLLFIPLVLGLALDQGVARFYIDAETKAEKLKIASSVLFYNLIVMLLVSLSFVLFTNKITYNWLEGQASILTINIVFILIYVKSIYYIALNQLKWQFESGKFSICSVGNTILSISISLLLVSHFNFGICGIFSGQLAGMFIFSILALFYARHSYTFVFDFKTLKKLINYSAPLMPATVAFFTMQYIDRLFIKEMLSLKEVGLYGIGARVASLVQLLLMGFQGAFDPIVIKYYNQPGYKEHFAKIFYYFVSFTFLGLVLLSLFGKELLTLLTTEDYIQGYVVIPFLVGSAIMSSIAQYFTFGIQIKKKTIYRLYINMAAVLVNILLNMILIKNFGFAGGAVATLITFILTAIAGLYISQKLYSVPYNWGKIIGYMIVLFSIALFPLISEKILFNFWFALIVKTLLFIFSIIFTIFIMKMVEIKDIKRLLNTVNS